MFLLPPVFCMIGKFLVPGPEMFIFFQGSKSRHQLIYRLVYGVKSNLDLTGYLVYNLTLYPVRCAP